MDDDAPVRKSRFDQTEPPPRPSRFDRRSRSPIARKPADTVRSRSPVSRDGASPAASKGPVKDPVKAAAEAAARINAVLEAKKASQRVDTPPIKSASTPTDSKQASAYSQDGDFIKDIEVNDLRNRYTLTKGATQKMIKEISGADVTTRGEYYPDKNMASPAAPPLYLHVTSQTKEGLDKAVAKIEELMSQELPNLIDERRFRRREPDQVERDEFGRRKWPEERIPIDLEPIPGFNLRAQVVGSGGAYVKYIQGKTKCRVQIKGRGSGFTEQFTNQESDEPMYLHVAGPDPAMVQVAKQDCLDLLANVKTQYEEFKARGPSNYGRGGGDHYGGQRGPGQRNDRQNSGNYGGGGQDQQSAQGYGGYGYGAPAAASPTAAAASDNPYAAQWEEYYRNNPQAATADPYAAYGGYEAYQQMYAQYYQQQQQSQAGSPVQAGGAYGAPGTPGAPGAYSAPGAGSPVPGATGGYGGYGTPAAPQPATEAPPPPPGAAPGGYNAVPPPPGM